MNGPLWAGAPSGEDEQRVVVGTASSDAVEVEMLSRSRTGLLLQEALRMREVGAASAITGTTRLQAYVHETR
jgi:hypothetical protein